MEASLFFVVVVSVGLDDMFDFTGCEGLTGGHTKRE